MNTDGLNDGLVGLVGLASAGAFGILVYMFRDMHIKSDKYIVRHDLPDKNGQYYLDFMKDYL